MDEKTFYEALHKELADKFNTTPSTIRLIRHFVIGEKRTAGEIVDILSSTIQRPRYGDRIRRKRILSRRHSKVYYQRMLAFLAKCTAQQLDEIVKVKYGK